MCFRRAWKLLLLEEVHRQALSAVMYRHGGSFIRMLFAFVVLSLRDHAWCRYCSSLYVDGDI